MEPGAGTRWFPCFKRAATLQGIAYLAAYMLRDGERVADFFRMDKDSLVLRSIQVSKLTLTDMLRQEAFRPALYADCSDTDVALARSLLSPEPSLPALTRLKLSPEKIWIGAAPLH